MFCCRWLLKFNVIVELHCGLLKTGMCWPSSQFFQGIEMIFKEYLTSCNSFWIVYYFFLWRESLQSIFSINKIFLKIQNLIKMLLSYWIYKIKSNKGNMCAFWFLFICLTSLPRLCLESNQQVRWVAHYLI